MDRQGVGRIPDVEIFANSLWPLQHELKSGAKVVDITPRADLRTVAVHLQRFFSQRIQNEPKQSMFAGSSRPKNIKGSHYRDWHFRFPEVRLDQVFPGQLRNGIAPAGLRNGTHARRTVLIDAKGIDTEDLAGREVDETLQLLTAFHRLEQPGGTDVVGLQCLTPCIAHSIHPDECCSVYHHVSFLTQAAQIEPFLSCVALAMAAQAVKQIAPNKPHVRVTQ